MESDTDEDVFEISLDALAYPPPEAAPVPMPAPMPVPAPAPMPMPVLAPVTVTVTDALVAAPTQSRTVPVVAPSEEELLMLDELDEAALHLPPDQDYVMEDHIVEEQEERDFHIGRQGQAEAFAKNLHLDAVKLRAMQQVWSNELDAERHHAVPSFLEDIPDVVEPAGLQLVESGGGVGIESPSTDRQQEPRRRRRRYREPLPREALAPANPLLTFATQRPTVSSFGAGLVLVSACGTSVRLRRLPAPATAPVSLLNVHAASLPSIARRHELAQSYAESVSMAGESTGEVWSLLESVFARDGREQSVTQLHQALTDWLQRYAPASSSGAAGKSLGEQEQEDRDEPFESRIVRAIESYRLDDATRLAIQHRCPRLATLLAQDGGLRSFRRLMREQVVSWQESEVWEAFSSGMQRLYTLLGGMTSGHDHTTSDKSWLHDFAIEFWYYQEGGSGSAGGSAGGSAEASLAALLDAFSFRPAHDRVFELLSLRCRARYPAWRAVLPPPQQPLDYSTSWLAIDPLISVGHRISRLKHLVMSYVAQLESLGHWQWAVYVIASTQQPFPTPDSPLLYSTTECHMMLEHLLSRNWPPLFGSAHTSATHCVRVGYSADARADASAGALSASKPHAQFSDVEANIVAQLNQLCSEAPLLNIEPLIFKAKALRAQSMGDHRTEVQLLLQAGEWRRAYHTFIADVVPHLVIYEQWEELCETLALLCEHSLSAGPDWYSVGAVFHEYATARRLHSELPPNLQQRFSEAILAAKRICLHLPIHQQQKRTLTTLHTACMSEIVSYSLLHCSDLSVDAVTPSLIPEDIRLSNITTSN